MGWRGILRRYSSIMDGEIEARYLETKSIDVDFSKSDSTNNLWKIHDKALDTPKYRENPSKNLLDLKIELATRIERRCTLCERRCGVDRTRYYGACKVKETRIASEFIHIGEEDMLVPSHTVFFSGCPFRCVFCQNWDISQRKVGIHIDPEIMARIISTRHAQGAVNVNWVGGEPTPHIPYILKVLKFSNENIPQIWNSNMYCSIESMKLLDGIIDLYLTDFKYGNNICAERLSKIKGYLEVVERNHIIAYNQGDMIVRHLVLPNHVECCTRYVLRWISENIPGSLVNIMPQYRPEYMAGEYEDISRHLSKEEFERAISIARDLDLNYL